MRTFVNIEDLRRAAKWNMPKPMFEYVDGGANAEWTLRENRAGFERMTFDPRVLVDVSERDQSTTVFGETLKTRPSSRRPA
jgi:isopentenyl diphosphate isomerase/L-lactate dehydrogenase-like FMN-dependent dehydrogenase